VQVWDGSQTSIILLTKINSLLKRHVPIISQITIISNSDPVSTWTSRIAHITVVSKMSIRFTNPRIATHFKTWQTRTLTLAFHLVKLAQVLALTTSRVFITLIRRFSPNWWSVGDFSRDWSLSCFHFRCFSESFGWWSDCNSSDDCGVSRRGFR